MTYPEVQFVAAPEDGAAVLFDFNDNFGDAPAQIVTGSFSLGTPSIDGDPDGLGVQYGARTVGFNLLVFGNRQAAMTTQALLARTFMLRRRGWLRVRMDEFSAPVWLRTYTPTPAELDFSLIQPDSEEDAWRIEVSVAAEPFIRGERIELWSGTINNDPEHVTNPMGATMPPVIGDAPAPLRIEASFSETRNQVNIHWSMAAVPDGYVPVVWQVGGGDVWDAGGDTTFAYPSDDFSGGSFRWIDFSGGNAMAGRLAGVVPATPPPGRYKVLLRQARTVATTGGAYAFQLGYRTDAGDVMQGSVQTVDRLGHAWVDLGEFDYPLPNADVDIPSVGATPNIVLHAARTSGGEWVALDAFMLVPVALTEVTSLESWEKSDTLITEFGVHGPQAGVGDLHVWDGDGETSLRVSSAGVLDALMSSSNRGRFLTVRPGVNNHLTVIQQARTTPLIGTTVASDDVTDAITQTVTVSLSYQPRWLWLGDS